MIQYVTLTTSLLLLLSHMSMAHYILDDSKCRNINYPVLRNTLKYVFYRGEKTDPDPSTGLVRDQIQCEYVTRKQTLQYTAKTSSSDGYPCYYEWLWPQQVTCEADYVEDHFARIHDSGMKGNVDNDVDNDISFEVFAFVFSHWNCYSNDNWMITSGLEMICPFRKNNTLCDVHMSQCYVRFSGQESIWNYIKILAVVAIITIVFFGFFIWWWCYVPTADEKLKLF